MPKTQKSKEVERIYDKLLSKFLALPIYLPGEFHKGFKSALTVVEVEKKKIECESENPKV